MEITIPTPREDFDQEISNYYTKKAYDAGHIIEYLGVAYHQYVITHDPKELDRALMLSLKPLAEFINQAETNENMYKASYIASSKFREETESSVRFWRTVATILASLSVAWAVMRSTVYLWPVIEPALAKVFTLG